jgi:tRNA threonylcarbamoyladenosine biosynthesis protein TsaE
MVILSTCEEDTLSAGKQIGSLLKRGSVVSLQGGLGAGKTVLTKGIALALGIEEVIVSPSFTLIQEYEGIRTLTHMDLYRLQGEEEFEQIGGEEYLYSDGITVIEWAEKIADLLPDWTIFVDITVMDSGQRTITVRGLTA